MNSDDFTVGGMAITKLPYTSTRDEKKQYVKDDALRIADNVMDAGGFPLRERIACLAMLMFADGREDVQLGAVSEIAKEALREMAAVAGMNLESIKWL